ncbi:MAG: hypothetical protein HYY24_24820 [Verrucomicrobia bacterium]|nr:hypothetical protein [Verrucomicrobiota bacterium]
MGAHWRNISSHVEDVFDIVSSERAQFTPGGGGSQEGRHLHLKKDAAL